MDFVNEKILASLLGKRNGQIKQAVIGKIKMVASDKERRLRIQSFLHTLQQKCSLSNTPRSFQVSHRASEANKKYLIGLLNAGGELFQVTIYATSTGQETYRIQQLSISRQTAAF